MTRIPVKTAQISQRARTGAAAEPDRPKSQGTREAAATTTELSATNTALSEVDRGTAENLAARQGEQPKPGGGMLGFLGATRAEQAKSPDGERAWFSTDWFLQNKSWNKEGGDPRHNLWAQSGPLDKLDAVDRAQGSQGGARAFEQHPIGVFDLEGAHSGKRGGAIEAKGRISERSFLSTEGFRSQVYQAAFGVADAELDPPIRGYDFVRGDSGFLGVPPGGRVAPVLDGRPLDYEVVTQGDDTVVKLTRDGEPLSWADSDRAHFGVLDKYDRPLGDGKLKSEIDFSWFGNCNDASYAGIMFERPKRPVTLRGVDAAGKAVDVTFSPRDIEGLLTVVAGDMQAAQAELHGSRYYRGRDQLKLKDGRVLQGEVMIDDATLRRAKTALQRRDGLWKEIDAQALGTVDIKLLNGELMHIPAEQIESSLVQSGDDLRPWDLRDKVLLWSKEGGGVADIDPYDRVFNRPFKSAESKVFAERPEWATPQPREQELPADLRREWGELTIEFGDQPRTYRYWTAYDGDKPVDGDWIVGPGSKPPPDFLWRPKPSGEVVWPDSLSRNPWVDVALVKKLYQQSIADD